MEAAVVLVIIFIAVFADFLLDYDTQVIGQNLAERLQSPNANHWFGTDELGRDIFCRILYGTRFSCSVGLVAVTIGLVIGVTLGAIAGFFGGWLEELIMRCTDILGAVPNMLMAIVIVSVLGQSIWNLMLAVGITSVPQFVRITRAAVLLLSGTRNTWKHRRQLDSTTERSYLNIFFRTACLRLLFRQLSG